MKIYSMTATFGSLEHSTLTLKPGLNIIEAPNEWGKSTWCAFLVNMLYGLDTRAKSSKTSLAEKDRYTPWSGTPMSGRIDLNWNGRDITIERRTSGRLLFGEFSAYETATGLEIPELNGSNCGTMLLGVERSVFVRSGFLTLTDLPVTQDEALRRRLNSLVTTGDESGAGDKLQQALKDLKNKCRYNRTGLLPQAESQRDQLENQIYECQQWNQQKDTLSQRQKELEDLIFALENHKVHLRYQASLADIQKVKEAEANQQLAEDTYQALQATCANVPSLEQAQNALNTGRELAQQQQALRSEEILLPSLPQVPLTPPAYEGLLPEQALSRAQEDFSAFTALEAKKKNRKKRLTVISAFLGIFLVLSAVFGFTQILSLNPAMGIFALCAILMVGAWVIHAIQNNKTRKAITALYDRYPGIPSAQWISTAQAYVDTVSAFEQETAKATALRGNFDSRMASLQEKIAAYCQNLPLQEQINHWEQICKNWDALAHAEKQWLQSKHHLDTLRSMLKTAPKPEHPDTMTESESETVAKLNFARFELQQTQQKLGQVQGRSETLGQESLLKSQLRAVQQRIHKLEDTYTALEHAQHALSVATSELQRRFAPRISKRTQELFAKLTGNRYARLTLSEDFSLNTSAQEEDTLHSALWRSDGTVDQLYLALRLAVAEELTPDAPMILDDALVRFDDKRLTHALDILKETAQNKQIILFTCQGREKQLLGGTP